MSAIKYIRALCLIAFLTPLTVSKSHGFEVKKIIPLSAHDSGAGDQYGFSSTTDGHWLLIGAKSAELGGSAAGAVYIYKYNRHQEKWNYFQKLVPDNGLAGAEFGESVAIFRNKIVIGSRSNITANGVNSGTAYVYTFRGKKFGWVLEQTLEPVHGADGDEFGRSVAIGRDRLMVGARFARNSTDEQTGAVYSYIFDKCKKNWVFEEKIMDPTGKANDQFGRSIFYTHFKGGLLAIASRNGSNNSEITEGKVLLYKHNKKQWVVSQILTGKNGQDGDYFGQSIAISNRVMVIGARNAKDEYENKSGVAYIYQYNPEVNAWEMQQKLMAPDGKDKAQYGFAVALNGGKVNQLAVSARRADTDSNKKTGKVYLYSFKKSEKKYTLDDIAAPETLKTDDEFGQSLAMDPLRGDWLVVGADHSSLSGDEKAGVAYLLSRKK